MVVGIIGEAILKSIKDLAQDAARDARGSKVSCPGCGRLVIERELVRRGCYLCGWKPGDEDSEARGAGRSGPQWRSRPYRATCTRCGTMNVTELLMERGCYVCGLKPIALESDYTAKSAQGAPEGELARVTAAGSGQEGDA